MKPVELIQLALEDQPSKKVILDVFGGSGSTMIAAEKLGKQARLMELDPKYCDVIVKRWEDFTGKKAVLSEL
jgi:DNA modification methylase